MTPGIATVAYLLLAFGALSLYSLVLLAVFAGRAYENGYRAAERDQQLEQRSNVRMLRHGDRW